jgi:hypothetical protein
VAQHTIWTRVRIEPERRLATARERAGDAAGAEAAELRASAIDEQALARRQGASGGH